MDFAIVRELGIPIVTYRIKGEDGRSIAAYKFGDVSNVKNLVTKSSGRTALSKALKKALIDKYGSRCFIYMETMDENILQVDHRVPYEISGEQDISNVENFMLLSPSANRRKSWTCEHCVNWKNKDPLFCMKCFWAYPEHYEHIAGKNERIIYVLFSGDEIEEYDNLMKRAGEYSVQEIIKEILRRYLKN